MKSGFGKMHYKNIESQVFEGISELTAKYNGNFKFDQKHGYGTMEWSDDSIFEGMWKNDELLEGRLKFQRGNQT